MKTFKNPESQCNRESVLKKLNSLENPLIKKADKAPNFKEASAYFVFAPSYLYKLTHQKVIPHYTTYRKTLFFSKCELDGRIFFDPTNKSEKLEEAQISELSKGESDEADDEPP